MENFKTEKNRFKYNQLNKARGLFYLSIGTAVFIGTNNKLLLSTNEAYETRK